MTSTTFTGSGRQWGPLWGSRPYDWAGIEEQQRPTYDAALTRLALGDGDRVLDVGCGSGVFLQMAAGHGAHVSGADASETLLALARTRVPQADLRVADMEALPFEDERFDVVTGFNSFFYAADMVAALREAARVSKPGGTVLVQVFGDPEHCALEAVKDAILRRLPREVEEPPPFWQPGVLGGLAREAGLEPRETFTTEWAFTWPDERSILRSLLAVGGAVAAAGALGHDPIADAIREAVRPYRREDGSYELANQWRFLRCDRR